MLQDSLYASYLSTLSSSSRTLKAPRAYLSWRASVPLGLGQASSVSQMGRPYLVLMSLRYLQPHTHPHATGMGRHLILFAHWRKAPITHYICQAIGRSKRHGALRHSEGSSGDRPKEWTQYGPRKASMLH